MDSDDQGPPPGQALRAAPPPDSHQASLVLGADANALTAAGEHGISVVAHAAGVDPTIVATGAAQLDRPNTPTN